MRESNPAIQTSTCTELFQTRTEPSTASGSLQTQPASQLVQPAKSSEETAVWKSETYGLCFFFFKEYFLKSIC